MKNGNRFAILSDLNIESTQDNRIPPNGKNQQNAEIVNSNPGYCPPISLYDVNIKKLVEQLKNREDKIEFKITNKINRKSKLYLKDPMVHDEMMALLKEKGIESYSFTPKPFRSVNLILRGLHYLTDVADVKAELDGKVPDTILEILKFKTSRSIKENYETGLF